MIQSLFMWPPTGVCHTHGFYWHLKSAPRFIMHSITLSVSSNPREICTSYKAVEIATLNRRDFMSGPRGAHSSQGEARSRGVPTLRRCFVGHEPKVTRWSRSGKSLVDTQLFVECKAHRESVLLIQTKTLVLCEFDRLFILLARR